MYRDKMPNLRTALTVAGYNFRSWHRNPRILITFILEFILCFLLSDKAMNFALAHDTTLQILEPFIWTFGDSNSIMLSSMLLLLLFADMPFLTSGTPFYLMRTDRKTWMLGQLIYVTGASFIYLLNTLLSTALVCMTNAFPGDKWSKTAAMLGYSGEGRVIALPALVKTLEMSYPYRCTATIFLLMLLYTLVMVFIMLLFNIWKGYAAGMVSAFTFTVYGLLLNPNNLQTVLRLPDGLTYKVRVWCGWLSPLNHATYHMHNFGYDRLPRLWQSYAIYAGLLAVLIILSVLAIRQYSFNFRGTEEQ